MDPASTVDQLVSRPDEPTEGLSKITSEEQATWGPGLEGPAGVLRATDRGAGAVPRRHEGRPDPVGRPAERTLPPDATEATTILDDCRHWTQQERPAEANEALLDFLTATGCPDASASENRTPTRSRPSGDRVHQIQGGRRDQINPVASSITQNALTHSPSRETKIATAGKSTPLRRGPVHPGRRSAWRRPRRRSPGDLRWQGGREGESPRRTGIHPLLVRTAAALRGGRRNPRRSGRPVQARARRCSPRRRAAASTSVRKLSET